MREKKIPSVPAFMTVEASLVMLIVIPILVSLVFLSFALCGRCRMETELSIRCFQAAGRKDVSREEAAADIGREALTGSFFGLHGIQVTTGTDGESISAESSASAYPGRVAGIFQVPSSSLSFTAEAKARQQDIPEDIRKVRRIQQVLKNASEYAGEGE